MMTTDGRGEGGRKGEREGGRYLLQVARDGDLHGAVDAEGVQPGLALRIVLEPGALVMMREGEGGKEG